jgi:hypothetical protein
MTNGQAASAGVLYVRQAKPTTPFVILGKPRRGRNLFRRNTPMRLDGMPDTALRRIGVLRQKILAAESCFLVRTGH